ncbi:MAG: type III-B CRISPR module-associated protein Cmr3 [Planctomycetota bacterium]
MGDEMTTGVWLKPLDTLFFRDGRPFQEASRVTSGLPQPQTIAGALRTSLLAATGFQFGEFAAKRKSTPDPAQLHKVLESCGAHPQHIQARFRGPWLALKRGNDVQPLLPVPQTLVADFSADEPAPKNWRTALPRDITTNTLPGWQPLTAGQWPLWRDNLHSDAERPNGFLTLRGLHLVLGAIARGDEVVGKLETEFFPPTWKSYDGQEGALYGDDSRIGIEVNADRLTAADGMLYGINLLSLPDQVRGRKGLPIDSGKIADPYAGWKIGLYVEIIGPTDVRTHLDKQPIPLGGEGRHVEVSVVDQLPDWRQTAILSNKSVVYLATPGIFTQAGKSHWAPNAFTQKRVTLRGAASDKGFAVSGWDVARNCPKPTRFAVPAGAVYFIEGQLDFKHGSLCGDDEDVAQGWGLALQGAWK